MAYFAQTSSVIPHDLTDLIRGEGEWRNMQEVIRKTFRMTFMQMERQQEQINSLMKTTNTLKEALSMKMSEKEVNQLIANQDITAKKTQQDELTFMNHQLTTMKVDLERKASTRYVDDSLKRKVDKTDILMKTSSQLTNLSTTQGQISEITRISGEVGKLTMKMEMVDKTIKDSNELIKKSASSSETTGIQNQLNQVYSQLQECPKREEIARMGEQKMERKEIERMLSEKADKTSLLTHFTRVEQVLADQEKNITSVRLRMNDALSGGGFDNNNYNSSGIGDAAGGASKSGTNINIENVLADVSMNRDGRTQNKNKTSNLEYMVDEMNDNTSAFDENLVDKKMKDAHNQTLLKNVFSKINQLVRAMQRVNNESKDTRDRMNKAEINVQKEKDDTDEILKTVTELKRKLDGVVSGAIPIKGVESFMFDHTAKMDEMRSFLQLPHGKNLKVQLGDILKTIEGLKHFAEESHSVAKRHDDELIRISKLEKSISKSDSVLKSIESVVSSHALEVDRIARIENRLDQYETASKKLENLVDEKLKFYVTDRYIQEQLSKFHLKLVQIENSIGGDTVTTARELMSTVVEVQSRLRTMESRFIKFKEDAESLTHRSIRELAREVQSAKRSAVSRMLYQSMEREKHSRGATPKGSKGDKSSTQFFGDVDVNVRDSMNTDNSQNSPRSAPLDVSTAGSLIIDDSPTLKQLEPRVGGVSAEESATIRSLDARLKQLQAEKESLQIRMKSKTSSV